MKKFLSILCLVASAACAKPAPSESVVLLNATKDHVVLGKNADQVRSIASITKLMTAMVALDSDRNLNKRLMLSRRVPSKLPRQEYTRAQLLEAMLINSDNAAAETIAEDYPGGREAFIRLMNWYAFNWGLTNTHFNDPSGLSPFNTSTARNVADMVHTASAYWFIRDIGSKKQTHLETKYKKKTQTIKLNHTSGSILSFDNVIVSKTGLTNAAGWCVGLAIEKNRQEYVIVVLGAKNKNQRLNTVKEIMNTQVTDN
jgi:D-alanyl-D-alanine endopeptidase (penicillin-binding protein 7)